MQYRIVSLKQLVELTSFIKEPPKIADQLEAFLKECCYIDTGKFYKIDKGAQIFIGKQFAEQLEFNYLRRFQDNIFRMMF